MLTLEQVNAINDSLFHGDWNAALQPLEEQIDLRHTELPKSHPVALTALKRGLQNAETAAFWASALFSPNNSVRRFVRKILLSLKGEAWPIAVPLQKQLKDFWENETPLPFSNSAREAAARREQYEIVQNALEILLRAHPENFVSLWDELIKAARPAEQRRQEEHKLQRKRQLAYNQVLSLTQEQLITDRFGEEFAEPQKRMQLPARIWREIIEEAQNHPEVSKLKAELGPDSWRKAAQEWHPEQLFASVLSPYMEARATFPQREIAQRVFAHIAPWLDEIFEFGSSWPSQQQEAAGARLTRMIGQLRFPHETIMEKFPLWLEGARPALLERLDEDLQAHPVGRRGEDLAGLWIVLAERFLQALQRPHHIPEKDWSIPEVITPERIRALKIGEGNGRWNLPQRFEEAAVRLEASRRHSQKTQNPKAEPETKEGTPIVASDSAFTAPTSTVQRGTIHLGYSALEWTLATQEAERTGETVHQIIERGRQKIRGEVEAIQSIEERGDKLITPPIYIDTPIMRLSLWQVWEQQDEETAVLKGQLWPQVREPLWTLYEEKLEAFRRVETDEISPRLGEILNARELKEWKTSQRSKKRNDINAQINDISALLSYVEGYDAGLRMLCLLQRPGVRVILTAHQQRLLVQAGTAYFNANALTQEQAKDPDWLQKNWFLEEKWAPLLEELENALLDAKRLNDWEKVNVQRQLAVAHYRLNTTKGRERFLELARDATHLAPQMALPVTALGDIESWLLLIAKLESPFPLLRDLWSQIREQPSPKSQELVKSVLQMLSTTTGEKAAKFQIELVEELTRDELNQNANFVIAALESSLVSVKRWALKALPQIEGDFDHENAVELAGEMLWNENGALVKDAIKFLSTQNGESAAIAFESLQDATSLENQPILELIFRALISLKSKNGNLQLSEMALARLKELSDLSPARFGKLLKKLIEL